MNIYIFLLITIGIFALMRFWLIPKFEHTIQIVRNPSNLRTIVYLTVAQSVQTTALIATFSVIAVVITMAVLSMYGGTSAEELSNAIQVLRNLRQTLSEFNLEMMVIFAVAAILMLAYLAHKNAKRRVTNLFRERYEQEFERLKKEYENGNWNPLSPTPEMQEVENEILNLVKVLEGLDGSTEGDEHALREEITRDLDILSQHRFSLDVHRRMDLNLDPEQVLGNKPVTLNQRVLQFFISQGLLNTFQGFSRLLFFALTVLLVPALLGVQIPAIANSIDNRLLKLNDLRIEATQLEAQKEWQQAQKTALEAPTKPEGDEIDDDEAMDSLSRHFEEGLAAYSRHVFTRQSGVSLRSQAVRKQILQNVAHANGSHADISPSLAQADGIDNVSKETINAYENAFNQKGPRTKVGQQFRKTLDEVRLGNHELWIKLKTSAHRGIHSFQIASTTDDIGRFLFNNLFGLAMEPTVPDGPLGNLVKTLHEGIDPAKFKKAYDASAYRFMTDLANGKSAAEATSSMAKGSFAVFTDKDTAVFGGVMQEKAWGDGLHYHPPTLVAKVEQYADYERAAKATDKFYENGSRRPEFADSLTVYNDHFPGQFGDESKTKRAAVIKKWNPDLIPVASANPPQPPGEWPQPPEPMGGGGGGWGDNPPTGGGGGGFVPSGGPSGSPHGHQPSAPRHSGPIHTAHAKPAMNSFTRARSFLGLRGFSRIGGVLIGNEPERDQNDIDVDFRDISWKNDNGSVYLTLVRVDGQKFTLGPFRKHIVERALAYAADDRKVTATMITAPPLKELKVLLHPALVDTAMGCRAIEIDRFVDTYASDPKRRLAEQIVFEQNALYQLAWAIRIETLLELPDLRDSISEKEKDYFSALKQRANQYLKYYVEDYGNKIEFIENPHRSPVVAKQPFYDKTLVNDIKSCATSMTGIKDFYDCIHQKTIGNQRIFLSNDGPRWFVLPPEFQVWSGVREQTYKVDRDLQFAQAKSNVNKDLWPFEFMLQVAFTTPPEHLPDNEKAENYIDLEPWEFSDLKQDITQYVFQGIETHPNHKQVFLDTQEFTVLQRLFRAIINSHLGANFPMEKLVDLTKDAQNQNLPPIHTPRWNPRPGTLEAQFAIELFQTNSALQSDKQKQYPKVKENEKINDWIKAMGTSLEACENLVLKAKAPKDYKKFIAQLKKAVPSLPMISQQNWHKTCGFGALENPPDNLDERMLSLSRYIFKKAKEIENAREIRDALNVDYDVENGKQCLTASIH